MNTYLQYKRALKMTKANHQDYEPATQFYFKQFFSAFLRVLFMIKELVIPLVSLMPCDPLLHDKRKDAALVPVKVPFSAIPHVHHFPETNLIHKPFLQNNKF